MTHGHTSSKNGHRVSRTYKSWDSMKQRCNNPQASNAQYYNHKGITYDPDWEDFNQFLFDMGERPDNMSLERKDTTKGYSKNNCCWATPAEQAQNRTMLVNNTSGTKGVLYDKRAGKWRAFGERLGKRTYLYAGSSKDEAIIARKVWEQNA